MITRCIRLLNPKLGAKVVGNGEAKCFDGVRLRYSVLDRTIFGTNRTLRGRSGKNIHRGYIQIPTSRLPKDFIWKFLDKVITDVENSLCSDYVHDVSRELRGIVRRRDIVGYLTFTDRYSLTSLNAGKIPVKRLGMKEIRALRLFTMLKKYDFPNSPIDTESVAKESFMKYEALCDKTNQDPIFDILSNNSSWDELSTLDCVFYAQVLKHAKALISRVLGTVDITEILCDAHHGPGASVGIPGLEATPLAKWKLPMTVTETCKNLAWFWLASDDRFVLYQGIKHLDDNNAREAPLPYYDYLTPERLFVITETSKIRFVPKSAKTKRTIAIEPTCNMALQLAVGSILRKKLRMWGIDISDQSKNNRLAQQGSELDTNATLDLSGASDSVALAWLKLLPPDWAELLSLLRCEQTTLPGGGTKLRLAKVSSMGNGYTFGLETLIFTSLLYGVVKYQNQKWEDHIGNIAVYGDDIICPKRFSIDLAIVLKRFGFLVNKDKSFIDGPIRESCGTDFYRGKRIDVPHIMDRVVDTVDIRIIYNRLIQVSLSYDFQFNQTCEFLLSYIPELYRNFGPVVDSVTDWFFQPTIPKGWPVFYHAGWKEFVVLCKKDTLHYRPKKHGELIWSATEALLYLEKFHPQSKGFQKVRQPAASAGARTTPHYLKSSLVMRTSVIPISLDYWSVDPH